MKQMPLSIRAFQALVFRSHIFAFLSFELLFSYWTKLQATNYQVWWLLECLLVSPRTTYIPWDLCK